MEVSRRQGGVVFSDLAKSGIREGEGITKDTARLGFVRVEVTLGSSTWKTSLFPSKEGEYFLPVKKTVREKEDIGEGSKVTWIIKLI